MKKPKKSGSDYYNYKGFSSLVLLDPAETEYRFLWIDCGSSGSCSDARIFNRNDLGEKIEEGSKTGGEWPDLHYFLLGDDAFALMPWMAKTYSRRQLTKEKRIGNDKISRGRRVVENAFGFLVSWFRVLLGTMEQRPRVVRDIVVMCMVLHNMLRAHQGKVDRAPIPANDVEALQNEQAVYVPNENDRNSSREAKHQQDLLKDYFNHVGALPGQEDRT